MGKIRNLKYQFKRCIDVNFCEGINKHSLKQTGKKGTEVFSYSQRKNLIDLSANFSNWMKEKYPEIRQVKDVTQMHIQEFLSTKRECTSQATLDNWRSQFNKLEKIVSCVYRCDVNYHTEKVYSVKNGGGKLRTDMLSEKDYNILLSNSTNNNFKIALKLSYTFGCRCEELVRLRYSDIDIKDGVDDKVWGIHIVDSKGKRTRFVKATNEKQKQLIKELKENGQQGRVCAIQKGSLMQAMNREKKKNGISSHSDFHASRKAFATNKYLECREQGKSIQESLNVVSGQLGHSENGSRNSLMKEYICCPIV